MKVLLLQPPIQDFYETNIRLQPIGLCYLKAAVQKYLPSVQVKLKDYHQGWGRRTLPIPKELSYLRDYYACADQSPFSTFHHYYHFGADFEIIAQEVAGEEPDLIGISSLFSPYYREALQTAARIKKRLPNIPILFGGSHVSAMPDSVLNNPSVDFIICGEGEKPFVELLRALLEQTPVDDIPGLGFKRGQDMIINPVGENFPLDEIPHPDLSDFNPERYLYERKPISFVITSRSCPHRCTFCSVHKTFGFKFRRRSSQDVLSEILFRYDQGIRVFDFEDDNLTYYREEMKTLCRELISAFPNKDVQFVAMNGISYLSLDRELLALMKEAGFTHLNLALVSSDVTVRETTKRPHTIEKYLEIVQEGSQLGFHIVSYQILGLPNESLDSMIQTLIFNAAQPVLMGASLFYLTPNSPISSLLPAPTEADVFKARLTSMAIETESFSRSDLYTLFIITRILNFLKGLTLDHQEVSIDAAIQQTQTMDKRSQLGGELLETLLREHRLYAHTTQGRELRQHFKPSLFFKVWNQLSVITTQNRQVIKKANPSFFVKADL